MMTTLLMTVLSLQAQAADCTYAEKFKELEQKHKALVELNKTIKANKTSKCNKETVYSFAERDSIHAMENMIEEEEEKLVKSLKK